MRFYAKLRIPAVLLTMLLLLISIAGTAAAAGAADPTGTKSAIAAVDEALLRIGNGDADASKQSFAPVKQWWTRSKQSAKNDSASLAADLDRGVADVSLAYISGNPDEIAEKLDELRLSLVSYDEGSYTDNEGRSKMTLGLYIGKLKSVQEAAEAQDWSAAQSGARELQNQWLSVEGEVVGRSASVYADTERDLVLLPAYLADPAKQAQAAPLLDRLIAALTPLADAGYGWVDAALIPIREGLEALLVVGSLLAFVRKSGAPRGQRWIVGGSAAGLVFSVAAGAAVSLWLSTSVFGASNSLLNGWTGVIAAGMLLYVGYWLHRSSDMRRWNEKLRSSSKQALSSGRMFSLALLAFLAIVREGLETVIFLIGLAGRMPGRELLLGIATGFGALALIAVVIVKLGDRLPLKPFFLVSSVVVFYLGFKFMGSGIHSLQMAGLIPSSTESYLPSAATISLYPSWYSTLPQLLLLLAAAAAYLGPLLRRRSGQAAQA
ncbi:iron permease FTR1 family protein [Saccharibacillus sp. O23]|uniref:FTR1 family iron permease n=1 Tax=Saccharibacillus sp. O23 TaxID=2009338 RepID=UPI000B4E623D|nr:FTR1 family protein [Saccharibacillus sp. O23]OWR31772.1 iron permease FTR1 family protein [Saccharibacillus sp. O23]